MIYFKRNPMAKVPDRIFALWVKTYQCLHSCVQTQSDISSKIWDPAFYSFIDDMEIQEYSHGHYHQYLPTSLIFEHPPHPLEQPTLGVSMLTVQPPSSLWGLKSLQVTSSHSTTRPNPRDPSLLSAVLHSHTSDITPPTSALFLRGD